MAGIVLRGKSVTDEKRAAFVKRMAAKMRTKAARKMAAAKRRTGKKKLAAALDIPGTTIGDEVNQPGANYYAREIEKGTRLRIIDLGGQQAVDFLCFDLADRQVRYNAANSIKLNETLYISTGFKLYSDTAEVLMTVTQDTVGKHDTIGGACSNQVNYLRYGITNTLQLPRQFHRRAEERRPRAARHPRQHQFLHARAGRQERPHRHPRRPVAAGRFRRAHRREGRARRDVQLPAVLQPVLGLAPDADPRHRLAAGVTEPALSPPDRYAR